MRTLFSRFEVRRRESESNDSDDILIELADESWDWTLRATENSGGGELPERWEPGEFLLPNGDAVVVEDLSSQSGRLWKLTLDKVGSEDSNITWRNHIFLATGGDYVEYSILQEAIRKVGTIGPFESPLRPPVITRKIVRNDSYVCTIGDEEVVGRWDEISDGDRETFLERVISDKRRLPIILLSKDWNAKKALVYPGNLASMLTGMARIHLVANPRTKFFNEYFGQQWTSNGSIRIHWPGKNQSDMELDSAFDNLLTKRAFKSRFDSDEEKLLNHLVNKVCLATVSNFSSSELVDRITSEYRMEFLTRRREEEEESRQAKVALLDEKEKAEYLQEELTKARDELTPLSLEIGKLKDKITQYEEKIERLENKINDLNEELAPYDYLKYLINEAMGKNPVLTPEDFGNAIRSLGDVAEEEEEEPEQEQFGSILEALEEAKKRFGARITILDDALESAEDTRSDAPADDVFELIKFLHNEVWDSMRTNPSQGRNRFIFEAEMKKKYGNKYAPVESPSTVERFGKERNANGRKFGISGITTRKTLIEINSHLKLGSTDNPLRVHLCAITENSKVSLFEHKRQGQRMVWVPFKNQTKVFRNIATQPRIVVGWCGDHLPVPE